LVPATAAGFAEGLIDAVLAISVPDSLVYADFQALAAALAEGLDETHLTLSRQAFGI
jgi:hypothetical protein